MRAFLIGFCLTVMASSYAEDQELGSPQGTYRSVPSFENSQAPGPYRYSKGEGTPDPHFFQNAPQQMMYRRDPTYHGDYYSLQYKRDYFRQPSRRSHFNMRPRSEKRHYPQPMPSQGFPEHQNFPGYSTNTNRDP